MAHHELEESDREEAIRQVDKAAGDLLRLLDNLLQWTTSQTGGMPFNPERFDLSQTGTEIKHLQLFYSWQDFLMILFRL